MDDIEILKLALSEKRALIKIYERIIKENRDLKNFADKLLAEDQNHKKMIENKIYELTL
ncbi:MAG: hypothetical protein ABH858_00710 [Candidatus Omnitrophota bacterium]